MKKPSIKMTRRLCQLFIIVLFIAIPILNKNRYSLFYGNLLSFHFWIIPLADPLAVLQLTIKNLSITLDSLIGALLVLSVAFFLGTVFCSWICPYGFFSELAVISGKKIFGRKNIGGVRGRSGFRCKLIIFVVGIVFFLVFSTTPVLNQLSLPAWYTRFFQYLFGQGYVSLSILVLLALLVMEFFTRQRFWCRYICPQSVLLSFAKRLNRKRLRVVFDQQRCRCKGSSDPCAMACTLSLKPKMAGDVSEIECTNCGDCVVTCSNIGQALTFVRGPERGEGDENKQGGKS
ncbi:4Fe-4S binding protein [Desulfomarina sp.]